MLFTMQPMDASAVLSGAAPVLAVRLTQLAGGGSILAVTASHVVLGEFKATVTRNFIHTSNMSAVAASSDE
jgi:hypothetical protein